MKRYSNTVHVAIEQINRDQMNTILEIVVPIKISARPTKMFEFWENCK